MVKVSFAVLLHKRSLSGKDVIVFGEVKTVIVAKHALYKSHVTAIKQMHFFLSSPLINGYVVNHVYIFMPLLFYTPF